MSRSLELVALRKELLVTRASVQRLRLAHQMGVLREELRLPRLAKGAMSSTAARGAIWPLVLMVAGRGRLGRWLRGAALAMSVAAMASRFMHGAARASSPPDDDAAKR
jgi:hypothetical protein